MSTHSLGHILVVFVSRPPSRTNRKHMSGFVLRIKKTHFQLGKDELLSSSSQKPSPNLRENI
ncbi:hypothetical protein H5410_057111 [Solanum commersonii]|uniref:Uncharacterized protein n=1 Tax=Solanum commersonii TaxID=4109 RepID=A0A9J5WM39_SOLCO|nr:hypothetical protein H5410_057111 [Solanum commersonii]